MKAAVVKPKYQAIATLKYKLLYSYIVFLIAYAIFTLMPAPAHATLLHYKISALTSRLLDTTIVLLLAGIWFAGFYGYYKLHTYARIIQKSKEGKCIAILCKGLLLLVLWLPISSVSSSVFNYIATKHTGMVAAATIVNNYINLILPLAGFIYIGRGANGLNKFAKQHISYRATCALAIMLVYIGLIYYHLLISTKDRPEVYHLSIWLLLITLIAPYIFMWFLGFLAAYEIYCYQRNVAGIVYRESWKFLGLGIGWLILTSIAFQYLTTLSARLSDLSLYWVLAIIYSLLLILSLGFIFIAIGASKLQKLEEV
jgi:hypothetical protein